MLIPSISREDKCNAHGQKVADVESHSSPLGPASNCTVGSSPLLKGTVTPHTPSRLVFLDLAQDLVTS